MAPPSFFLENLWSQRLLEQNSLKRGGGGAAWNLKDVLLGSINKSRDIMCRVMSLVNNVYWDFAKREF